MRNLLFQWYSALSLWCACESKVCICGHSVALNLLLDATLQTLEYVRIEPWHSHPPTGTGCGEARPLTPPGSTCAGVPSLPGTLRLLEC